MKAGLIGCALLVGARTLSAQMPADEQFVRGMLMHHAQALVMAAMVPERAVHENLKTLAQRIDLSQREEIGRMQLWLKARGDSGAAHDSMMYHVGHGRMPGMLTPAQLDSLRSLRGNAFEQRFLQYMIHHHEGALTMVAQLLAAPDGIRDPLLFQLANSIDADQRAEIARMRGMLSTPIPRK